MKKIDLIKTMSIVSLIISIIGFLIFFGMVMITMLIIITVIYYISEIYCLMVAPYLI